MTTFRADRPGNRGGFSGGEHDYCILHRVYTGSHAASSNVYTGPFPGHNTAGVLSLTSPKLRSVERVKLYLHSLTHLRGVMFNCTKGQLPLTVYITLRQVKSLPFSQWVLPFGYSNENCVRISHIYHARNLVRSSRCSSLQTNPGD